jgi:hypothetical protein
MEESKSTAEIAGLKNEQESMSTAGYSIAGLKNVQESMSTAGYCRTKECAGEHEHCRVLQD